MSYIGRINSNNTVALIGSTMYGICNTSAGSTLKEVTNTIANTENLINNHFDRPMIGVTIHIKFTQGNVATEQCYLKLGTNTTLYGIVGKFTCDAGNIISFTFDEYNHWVANDNVDSSVDYVFKTAYDPITNKILTESDIGPAAEKGIVTDIGANTTSTDLPTTAAVARYVQIATGGLSGLAGAMHFRGIATTEVTDGGTENPNIYNYTFNANGDNAGDVVLWEQEEYVWTGSIWELLGSENSYAFNSNTDIVSRIDSFTPNTLPTLTITSTQASQVTVTDGSAASLSTATYNIPNVTQAGTATTASVFNGVLTITQGNNTVLAGSPITVTGVDTFTPNDPTLVAVQNITFGSASGWNRGTQAALSATERVVVAPIDRE